MTSIESTGSTGSIIEFFSSNITLTSLTSPTSSPPQPESTTWKFMFEQTIPVQNELAVRVFLRHRQFMEYGVLSKRIQTTQSTHYVTISPSMQTPYHMAEECIDSSSVMNTHIGKYVVHRMKDPPSPQDPQEIQEIKHVSIQMGSLFLNPQQPKLCIEFGVFRELRSYTETMAEIMSSSSNNTPRTLRVTLSLTPRDLRKTQLREILKPLIAASTWFDF